MNQYKVRDLHYSDRESWLTLWQGYLEFYQTSLPPVVTDNTLNRLLSNHKNMGCTVACDSQNIPVGFLTFIIHLSTWNIAAECYVQDLYVKPGHRKTGLAKMLMEELKQKCQLQQWSRIYWITKPNNKIAQNFYDKIGRGEPWIVYEMNEIK